MAAQNPPFAIQDQSHSAELHRRSMQSFLAATGVVGLGDLAVSANSPANMSVNVAPGQVWIPGSLGASTGMPGGFSSQGAYYGYNDGTVNLTVAASDATNPRVDLVVAVVHDSEYSGTTDSWALQVVTGTPAASPAAPAAPASSVPLAQISVAAGASSVAAANITDVRPFTSAAHPLRANPAGRIYQSTAQVLSNATVTQITNLLAPSSLPPKGGVTISGNGLVVPVAGIYQVNWGVTLATISTSGPTGVLQAILYKNGSPLQLTQALLPAQDNAPVATGADLFGLAAGDTLTLYGYQSSTTAYYTGDSNPGCYLSLAQVG